MGGDDSGYLSVVSNTCRELIQRKGGRGEALLATDEVGGGREVWGGGEVVQLCVKILLSYSLSHPAVAALPPPLLSPRRYANPYRRYLSVHCTNKLSNEEWGEGGVLHE